MHPLLFASVLGSSLLAGAAQPARPLVPMVAAAVLPSAGSGEVLAAERRSAFADLPSAPMPQDDAAAGEGVAGGGLAGGTDTARDDRRMAKVESEAERNHACETGQLHGKPCRVSWPRVLGSSLIFLAAQHGGNIWMDKDTRHQLTSGNFWGNYVYCVEHYRWSRWKDDDPFGVDYIGHPMMGSLTNFIYEQNDPKQRALSFENTHRYWMGRLRATAYSAAYSAQWKIGPASEASIGNSGIQYYVRARDGVYTNETGMQDWFITPIGGLAWSVGEDVIDRYIFSHVRHAHPRNRALLFVASVMTPTRSAANVARFRAPYYRDPSLGSNPVR